MPTTETNIPQNALMAYEAMQADMQAERFGPDAHLCHFYTPLRCKTPHVDGLPYCIRHGVEMSLWSIKQYADTPFMVAEAREQLALYLKADDGVLSDEEVAAAKREVA